MIELVECRFIFECLNKEVCNEWLVASSLVAFSFRKLLRPKLQPSRLAIASSNLFAESGER